MCHSFLSIARCLLSVYFDNDLLCFYFRHFFLLCLCFLSIFRLFFLSFFFRLPCFFLLLCFLRFLYFFFQLSGLCLLLRFLLFRLFGCIFFCYTRCFTEFFSKLSWGSVAEEVEFCPACFCFSYHFYAVNHRGVEWKYFFHHYSVCTCSADSKRCTRLCAVFAGCDDSFEHLYPSFVFFGYFLVYTNSISCTEVSFLTGFYIYWCYLLVGEYH